MTEQTPPTLAARLLAVMGEVGYIQKQGKTQSGPSFTYMKHDDVVAALRPALIKHGVAFMSGIDETSVGCEQVGVTKSGAARYKTTLVLRLTFVNVDDPAEAYSVAFPGEGVDTDDKGSGKALSYALKNGLLKMFLIEAGDEADVEQGAPPAVSAAVRGDQQREQAAAPPEAAPAAAPQQGGNGGNGTITQAEAKRLHENLLAKGRASKWFLGVIAGKGIGDGAHLTSVPSSEYDHLLAIVAGFADPPPPEPTTPAAAPVPTVSAADFTQAAPATQEAAQEVAAPAAASAASEPPAAAGEAPADEGEGAPPGMNAERYKAYLEEQALKASGKAKRKATVTPQQLTRLGAQCAELESLGVGRDEWRLYMMEKEGVSSRKDLTKAAATRCIDYLVRWLIDIKSGVAGPSEKAVA